MPAIQITALRCDFFLLRRLCKQGKGVLAKFLLTLKKWDSILKLCFWIFIPVLLARVFLWEVWHEGSIGND